MDAHRVSVHVDHTVMPFQVQGAVPTAGGFHDAMFLQKDKDAAPLCRIMKRVHGRADAGCDTAAAFTSWSITTPERVYDSRSGLKLPNIQLKCDITTAIPEWSHTAVASDEEREEVSRFVLRTMVHERGHSLSGENAALSIKRVIEALPARVTPGEYADALNAALQRLFHGFYIPAANDADVAYDAATNHGSIQGAEAVAQLGLGTSRAYDTIHGVPSSPPAVRPRGDVTLPTSIRGAI
jgi:hypothetical protein